MLRLIQVRSGLFCRIMFSAAVLSGCGGQADQASNPPEDVTSREPDAVMTPGPAAPPPRATNDGDAPPVSVPRDPEPEPSPEVSDDTPLLPSEPPPSESPPVVDAPSEPSPIDVQGCGVPGGYDRVFILQRDAASGICTDFVLRTADTDDPLMPGLSLPPRWTAEDMMSFACAPEGSMDTGVTPTYFTNVQGTVTFTGSPFLSIPARVRVHVVLDTPADDAGTASEQLISQQTIDAEDLDLENGCLLGSRVVRQPPGD